MDFIDRNLILIRKKQPYLDWAKKLPDPVTKISLEKLNEECNTYLIPESENSNEIEEYLKIIYELIFEEELYDWHTDEKDWPDDISYEKFKDWFEVEFHSMVIDTVDEKINKEDL